MGLGDVDGTTVPKITLRRPAPRGGGVIAPAPSSRVRVPHLDRRAGRRQRRRPRCCIDGAVGHDLAELPGARSPIRIEHPTGFLDVEVDLGTGADRLRGPPRRASSAPHASSSTAPSSPARDRRHRHGRGGRR